jgi:hypothetical protein
MKSSSDPKEPALMQGYVHPYAAAECQKAVKSGDDALRENGSPTHAGRSFTEGERSNLVQNEGLPLEQAMARGEAMMLKPHPVGRLLARPTKLVFAQ